MNELVVKVEGQAMSGKSCVASIIVNALHAAGYPVMVSPEEGAEMSQIDLNPDKVKAMAANVNVTLKVIQLPRNA